MYREDFLIASSPEKRCYLEYLGNSRYGPKSLMVHAAMRCLARLFCELPGCLGLQVPLQGKTAKI